MATAPDPELALSLIAIRSKAENLLASINSIGLQHPSQWRDCLQQFNVVFGQFRSLNEELCRIVGEDGPLLLDTFALMPQSLEGLEGRHYEIPENFRSRLEPAMEVEDRMNVDTFEKEGLVSLNNETSVYELKMRIDNFGNEVMNLMQRVRSDVEDGDILGLDSADIPQVVMDDGAEDALKAMQAAMYRGEGLRRPETVTPSTTPTPNQAGGSNPNSRPGSTAPPPRQPTPGTYVPVAPTSSIHVQQQQLQAQQMAQTGVAPSALPHVAVHQGVSKPSMPANGQYGVPGQSIVMPQPVNGGVPAQRGVPPQAGAQAVRYLQNMPQGTTVAPSSAQQMRVAQPQTAAVQAALGRGVPNVQPTPHVVPAQGMNPNMLHRAQGVPPGMVPKGGIAPNQMMRPNYPHQ
eukprot:TRINITY_DN10658_c0_g1_i1.p1 TRINITY_DN10658_c0_g1~~TRINITY_DN10658_c0_g1_i1.p1  ORF type:complete len:404 (+),score=63.39 TRINITY_DN10658_c0_g1_i1:53-1264(+)